MEFQRSYFRANTTALVFTNPLETKAKPEGFVRLLEFKGARQVELNGAPRLLENWFVGFMENGAVIKTAMRELLVDPSRILTPEQIAERQAVSFERARQTAEEIAAKEKIAIAVFANSEGVFHYRSKHLCDPSCIEVIYTAEPPPVAVAAKTAKGGKK